MAYVVIRASKYQGKKMKTNGQDQVHSSQHPHLPPKYVKTILSLTLIINCLIEHDVHVLPLKT